MDFEWNTEKAASNLRKHGISFEEAATVYGDPCGINFQRPGPLSGRKPVLDVWRLQPQSNPRRISY